MDGGAPGLTEAGVSDREAEVLSLVGAHLSNAQIANRLVISVRTVESHVSSLLRKLDVASRKELAQLAASYAGGSDAGEVRGGRDRRRRRVADPVHPAVTTSTSPTRSPDAGDVDLVLVAGFVSHLTLDWTERRHAHFLHRLGTFSRLIRFDKRGTGMSDRPGSLPDLETRMGDVAAVMDAARSEQAVLFGYSEGGPMAILYAATHPERVHALVIYSSYARRLWAPDYPWGFRPEERARYAAQLEQDWAWEADMRHMCPNADEELARWWGQRCRAATSPGAARALIEMDSLVDVRDTLGAVQAPTLVLHRRHDIDSHVEEGRYLADHIPGARFVELEGADHFVAVDPDQILDPVEEFVRSLESSTPSESSLTTLLALHPEEPIDPGLGARHPAGRRWRLPRRTRRRGAARACWPRSTARRGRCAAASRSSSAPGPRACTSRSGLHTAEVDPPRRDVAGAGVALAQDVASRAARGEVWVTSTLRDLTAGSGFTFQSRGRARGPLARPHHRARCGDLTWVHHRPSPTPASPSVRPRCSRWSGST